jgi:hypothetical protein
MYECKRCNYITEVKSNYNRHLNSKKHLKKTYRCNVCDYATDLKADYKRHMRTLKHKDNVRKPKSSVLKENTKTKFKMEAYICEYCEREFKSTKGLNQHMKYCDYNEHSSSINILKSDMKRMLGSVEELNKKTLTSIQNISNSVVPQNIVINNTFNTFNILNYLNKECSEAQSLEDFVSNVNVNSEELESFGIHGYIEGIRNMLVEKLGKLEVKKRPLHCTDTKRLTFYLKNDKVWEKSTNYDFLDRPIDILYTKQVQSLQNWKKENPDYLTNTKKSDTFTDIMVGITEIDKDENRGKYKKKIAKMLSNSVKFNKI